MTFADAIAALDEARRYALDPQAVHRLAESCQRRTQLLGQRGVLDHGVPYNPARWPAIPTAALGRITRGDVFALADGPAISLFTASYAFGMGLRGYGPQRYERIIANTASLGQILDQIREIGRCQGPTVAYAQLYGGDGPTRAKPGAPPWSRIDRLGPAFFTKCLYFAVPGALILDSVLATRVAELSGMPHLLQHGRPIVWTPYRYAVYLHWMTQTAAAVSAHTAPLAISPDLLELTLFTTSQPGPRRRRRLAVRGTPHRSGRPTTPRCGA